MAWRAGRTCHFRELRTPGPTLLFTPPSARPVALVPPVGETYHLRFSHMNCLLAPVCLNHIWQPIDMSIDYAALRGKLDERQRARIKAVAAAAVDWVPVPWSLEMIAWRHATDKAVHGYMPHYAKHFAPFRHRPINVLEIGIGTYGPRGGGASLRTWQRYFSRATIHGLDIVDKKEHEDKRIRVYQGDQSDQAFLRDLAKSIGRIDIIIDDGSHVNQHVLASFEALYPLLAVGGLYVIEDMQTAYLRGMGGSSTDLSLPGTSMNLVKGLCDEVNSMFIANRLPTPWSRWVESVHVYRNIAFIAKGDSSTYEVHEYAKTMMREERSA